MICVSCDGTGYWGHQDDYDGIYDCEVCGGTGNMSELNNALVAAINKEMVRAVKEHGPLTANNFHAMTILGEEFGESCRELLDLRRHGSDDINHRGNAIKELIQLVSVSIHLIHNLDLEKKYGST